jgi:predicted phage tail protein
MGVVMIGQEPVTIRLHGPLGDKYGGEHQFYIRSPREAIDALDANYPGFRGDFLAVGHYALLVDGDWRNEENCPDVANAPISKELDICPIIEGRFDPVTLIAGAITSLTGGAISGVAATVIGGIITLGLLTGISLLLAPKQKKVDRDSGKDDNYMFSGAENVTEQGAPVPLVYGRCFVGSVVVSAGFEVAEGVGGTTDDEYIWPVVGDPMLMSEKAPILTEGLAAIRVAAEDGEHVSPPYEQPDPFAVWPKPRWVGENE